MDINQLRDMVRVGKVSAVNGNKCTVRVTFPDKDDLVSQELPVIGIGSNGTLSYWVPEVDTQVLCIFMPNPSDRGMNDGFVVGAFYSELNPPGEHDPNVRCIKTPDGCFLRFDGQGNVEIHAANNLILTGANIFLN